MSVFIKGGMKKPKNCFGCDFNSSDCFCKINHGAIDRDFWDCDKPCPIVEILVPHGNLIDADALIKSFNEMEQTQIIKLIKSLIDLQPTVIETEGRNDR